jgi:hypothetical protein
MHAGRERKEGGRRKGRKDGRGEGRQEKKMNLRGSTTRRKRKGGYRTREGKNKVRK